MDWATFFKDYPAVIPAISALLVAILGFIFARWNSDRNKRLERRAAIHDMRIQEAREYVDTWLQMIRAIREFHTILLDEPKLVVSRMKTHKKKYSHLAGEIAESIQKKGASISILNDPELGRLNKELSSLMYPKIVSQVEVINKFTLENTYAIEDNKIKAVEVPIEADRLIVQMKFRLDKLAEKVP